MHSITIPLCPACLPLSNGNTTRHDHCQKKVHKVWNAATGQMEALSVMDRQELEEDEEVVRAVPYRTIPFRTVPYRPVDKCSVPSPQVT